MFMFDTHSDLFMRCCKETRAGHENYMLSTHLQLLREGKFGGSICVLFTQTDNEIPWPEYFWREMGGIWRNVRELEKDGRVVIVKNYPEIVQAMAAGKYFILPGLESLAAIGDDVDQIETLYRLGFRHVGLTWNEKNLLATGVKSEETNRGLTEAGRRAVERIEALGMLLDVSHLNEKSFWDLIEVAKGPVVATHSNAKSLCDHPRNLTDAQAIALAKTGGFIGINVCAAFVDEAHPSLETFVDHIDHFRDLIGIEHIALGFDYCNFLDTEEEVAAQLAAGKSKGDKNTVGIETPEKAARVLDELSRRGYTEEEIEQIAYKNAFRVLAKVLK